MLCKKADDIQRHSTIITYLIISFSSKKLRMPKNMDREHAHRPSKVNLNETNIYGIQTLSADVSI